MKRKLVMSGILGFGIGFLAGVIAKAIADDDTEDWDVFEDEDVSVCTCDEDCANCKYMNPGCDAEQVDSKESDESDADV